jgi:hypothetical protein
MLHQLPNPTLIYASGIDGKMKNQFRRPNLQFADRPINLVEAAVARLRPVEARTFRCPVTDFRTLARSNDSGSPLTVNGCWNRAVAAEIFGATDYLPESFSIVGSGSHR